MREGVAPGLAYSFEWRDGLIKSQYIGIAYVVMPRVVRYIYVTCSVCATRLLLLRAVSPALRDLENSAPDQISAGFN